MYLKSAEESQPCVKLPFSLLIDLASIHPYLQAKISDWLSGDMASTSHIEKSIIRQYI